MIHGEFGLINVHVFDILSEISSIKVGDFFRLESSNSESHTPQSCVDAYYHACTIVWLRVDHWANWRPRLVVAQWLVLPWLSTARSPMHMWYCIQRLARFLQWH